MILKNEFITSIINYSAIFNVFTLKQDFMCGRFENKFSLQDLVLMLGSLKVIHKDTPVKPLNIAPTEEINSLFYEEEKYCLEQLRWGIKFSSESHLIFNTRIETIKEKPFWQKLYDENRCLVPMTGFYEWKKSGSKKTPFRLFLPEEPLFFAAALYSTNKLKEKEVSLITTTPNKFVSAVHHRMPVIIGKNEIEEFFSHPVEENINRSVPLSDSVKMEMEPADI
jgi:putative SOS response-associated peptidase YedK